MNTKLENISELSKLLSVKCNVNADLISAFILI